MEPRPGLPIEVPAGAPAASAESTQHRRLIDRAVLVALALAAIGGKRRAVAPDASDEARLAEYSSLRSEITQRTAIQQVLLGLSVTVAGTIAGFVFSNPGHDELFMSVSLASATFGLLWLDHHVTIHQIGGYIENQLWKWEPSWEAHIRQAPKPKWWQIVYGVSVIVIFGGIAAASLVISFDESGGALRLLWALSALLTALATGALIALFTTGRAGLK